MFKERQITNVAMMLDMMKEHSGQVVAAVSSYYDGTDITVPAPADPICVALGEAIRIWCLCKSKLSQLAGRKIGVHSRGACAVCYQDSADVGYRFFQDAARQPPPHRDLLPSKVRALLMLCAPQAHVDEHGGAGAQQPAHMSPTFIAGKPGYSFLTSTEEDAL